MAAIQEPAGPVLPEARPTGTPGYVHLFRLLLYGGLMCAAIWGSTVVRAAAICALPFALMADWDGGLRHILRIVGVGIAAWAAVRAGPYVSGWLSSSLANLPAAVAQASGYIVVGLATLFILAAFGRALTRYLRRRRHIRGLDHILGGGIGAVEGGLLLACLSWLLVIFAGPLDSLRARLPADAGGASAVLGALADARAALQADDAGRWLTEQNPLESMPAIQTAQLMADVAVDPGQLTAAIDAGRLQHIAELPELRKYADALANDATIQQALEQGNFGAILTHPQFRAMLQDRDLLNALLAHRDEILAVLRRPATAEAPE